MENHITPKQLQCISILFSKVSIAGESKQIIISGFSNGRCTSSKELLKDEAADLISHLKSLDPDEKKAEKMRRKIIRMAHEMHWQYEYRGKNKADMKRIDGWCKTFGYLKKGLDNYTYKELPKLVSQFQVMHKQFLSKI